MAEAPADNFITTIEDSRRWRHIERRPGDIILSTPPKSGTTWMQGILTALLWPGGDAPGTRGQLSPWIDARLRPIDELVETVAAQTHRRYFKTHSPGDCIPFDRLCKYIVVYRDAADALASWANHRATMLPHIVEAMNEMASKEGVGPINPQWSGDVDELFEEWSTICSPVRHLASWWPRRHASNVLFVHYADLTADLIGEMRRIAAYLELEVDEEHWTSVADLCSIDTMRAEAEASGALDFVYSGGASSFFNKGGNGRGHSLLTEAQRQRCEAIVEHGLPQDAAAWLGQGSLRGGVRPNAIGSDPPGVQSVRQHPVFGRVVKHQTNAVQAISERRVDKAREDGLFDNLALHGKPIPDLDRHRPAGWWANRFVKTERNKVKALQLEDELRKAMPGLWRLQTETEVTARVHELNQAIDRYNKVTTLAPKPHLDHASTLSKWRELRDR